MYALQHHVDRLAEDHRRARRLAEALEGSPKIESVLPVDTNIVIFSPTTEGGVSNCLAHLDTHRVRAAGMNGQVRFVTHLGVDEDAIDTVVLAIETL